MKLFRFEKKTLYFFICYNFILTGLIFKKVQMQRSKNIYCIIIRTMYRQIKNYHLTLTIIFFNLCYTKKSFRVNTINWLSFSSKYWKINIGAHLRITNSVTTKSINNVFVETCPGFCPRESGIRNWVIIEWHIDIGKKA